MQDQSASPNLPAILAFDPGGTTGWCYFDIGWLERAQISDQDHFKVLFDLMIKIAGKRTSTQLHIVCERFDFRKSDQERDKIDYIAAEYVGVVKLFAKLYKHSNVKLIMQSASQVKEHKGNKENPPFWTAAKMEHLGLWIPGIPHAMDATRHYLYYRTFTLGDKTLLYKLKDFDG